MMQNYFFGREDNSINRSFLFLESSFGVTPDIFFTSFMKWVWSVKFSVGNNSPFLMSYKKDLNRKILL